MAVRPRAASFIPPLTATSGLMPVTGGYLAARDAWTSAWGSAVTSFVTEIREVQAGIRNAAEFGSAQLQGFGSSKNMDHIAKRWREAGRKYLVGGKAKYKWVDQDGNGLTITGIHEWIAKQDEAMRTLVAREMDAKVAAYCYRAVFVDHHIIHLPEMTFTRRRRFHGLDLGEETRTVPARDREYIGSPVASGYSRARMDLVWILRGDDLVGQFVSRAPYTLVAPATREFWRLVKKNARSPIAKVYDALRAAGELDA